MESVKAQPQMIDGFPRRNRRDLLTPAELAISKAIDAVEEAGAHPDLTAVEDLLVKAKDMLADYVEKAS